MICTLDLLHKALSLALIRSVDILKEIGTSQSIASFELELTTWVTAYYAYSEIENYHNSGVDESLTGINVLGDLNLQRMNESGKQITQKSEDLIFDSIQSVFDTLHEEVSKGVLIPRVRNHLELGVVDVQLNMDNHHDIVKVLTGGNPCHDCASNLKGIHLSEKDWLIDWVSKSLDADNLSKMKTIMDVE